MHREYCILLCLKCCPCFVLCSNVYGSSPRSHSGRSKATVVLKVLRRFFYFMDDASLVTSHVFLDQTVAHVGTRVFEIEDFQNIRNLQSPVMDVCEVISQEWLAWTWAGGSWWRKGRDKGCSQRVFVHCESCGRIHNFGLQCANCDVFG